MNKVTRACLLVVALLALVGLAAAGDKGRKHFNLADVDGRYVSAEDAFDISSVHAFAPPDGSLVGPPIPFATAEVMVADGKGNVCGESDGFYTLGTVGAIPGTNLGPSLYHGTYTIDPDDGRITILTCSDGAPSPTNKFCKTSTPCDPVTNPVSKTQVGYLQAADDAKKIVTVEQVFGDPNLSPGFLLHKRVWTGSGECDSERDRWYDRH